MNQCEINFELESSYDYELRSGKHARGKTSYDIDTLEDDEIDQMRAYFAQQLTF